MTTRSTILSAACILAALLFFTACKCSRSQSAEQMEKQMQKLQEEKEIIDSLKVDTERLMASGACLNPAPFIQRDAKGEIFLTEKERMKKPDYLLDPKKARGYATLSQKYCILAVLGVDRLIIDLYEQPVSDYDVAIYTIAAELDDGALSQFVDKRHYCTEDLSTLLRGEYAISRGALAWEFLSASVVEQLYVLSRNIDKLLPMFSDEIAATFSNNLSVVHDAFENLCRTNKDLIPLHTAMQPLYIIDAHSVEELREQLIELKGAIETTRKEMLQQ